MAHPVRVVRAVVSTGGTWLGALAPFPVDSPWWADVEPVTGRLDEVLGVPATVSAWSTSWGAWLRLAVS